jgi:hypothetical protein
MRLPPAAALPAPGTATGYASSAGASEPTSGAEAKNGHGARPAGAADGEGKAAAASSADAAAATADGERYNGYLMTAIGLMTGAVAPSTSSAAVWGRAMEAGIGRRAGDGRRAAGGSSLLLLLTSLHIAAAAAAFCWPFTSLLLLTAHVSLLLASLPTSLLLLTRLVDSPPE